MRILFISNLYEPYARGGAEVVVKRSIEAARAAGHDVALLTARPWRSGARFSARESEEHGLKICSFYPFNLFFYADDYRWPLPLRLLWHVLDQFNHHTAVITRHWLQRYKPDLVITHNLMGLGYTIPQEIRRAGIKHVHVLHDIQLAVRSGLLLAGQEHSWQSDGFAARLYQKAVRKQFGSPTMVVSPSHYLLSFYEQLGYFTHSKKVVLRNPVDQRFYGVARPQRESGPLRLLYVGQLAEHKGISVLLKAFAACEELHPGKQTLTIVGDGVLRAKVDRFAAQYRERVRVLGKQKNESLPELYAAHDLLLLPTLTYENSPSVIFESLASGIPVCVNAIGGSAEAIEDGVNGFVLKPGDVLSLQQTIERCYDRTLLTGIQAQTRKSVAGLSASEYWQRFTELLENGT